MAWGHSTSVNPMGVVIGSLKESQGILMTTWDSQEVSDTRSSIPTSTQRRFDVYADITAMYLITAFNVSDVQDIKRPVKRVKMNQCENYLQVLKILSRNPKKKNLVDLDKQWNDLSSKCVRDSFLSLDDLKLVMHWKLQRGKFRPQLKSLIESNSADNVLSITKEAFSRKWPENLNILTKLRGVGPATATAILSLVDPSVPFFSDEVAGMILKQEKLKYTVKEVLLYVDLVRTEAGKLNISAKEYEIMKFTEHYKNLPLMT